MHMWESVKEIQYYCGRLYFRHVVDKRMVHFFGNIHKTNNAIVQRCFSNFNTGDSLNVCAMSTVLIYRVAQKKVSHYRESSLNRIKNRQPG